ncbi:MAG TPA: PhoH family protein [Candidatus Polarisedimenticolia bacterium]|nr:PhoH family protein [Dongiaceae bacterium]HYV89741.1 PhoH family protein [Candidatus Polarisedimenticolia bacterium]
MLYGEHDRHLARIEQGLGVSLVSRGNQIGISGNPEAVDHARQVLSQLYQRLKRGLSVDQAEIDAAVRRAQTPPASEPGLFDGDATAIRTQRRHITPRTPMQAQYMRALQENELAFGIGPAGTGKTYLAVAVAVALLTKGEIDRIVLSRPAVEAGERLGFLPGDLREKVDPYLRPLYDALHDMMPADQVLRRMTSGEIEIAPLAFMRGRTLSHSFVILDEAQNTTPVQMKMFLTRLGEKSRMAVTGDLSQVDLPAGQRSGLQDAVDTLSDVEGLSIIRFTDSDIVRHPLVGRIVRAYEARDAKAKKES